MDIQTPTMRAGQKADSAPAASALTQPKFALPCDLPVDPGMPCPHPAEFTADFHDCSTKYRPILISRHCLKDLLKRIYGKPTHCTYCKTSMTDETGWIKNVRPICSTPGKSKNA